MVHVLISVSVKHPRNASLVLHASTSHSTYAWPVSDLVHVRCRGKSVARQAGSSVTS